MFSRAKGANEHVLQYLQAHPSLSRRFDVIHAHAAVPGKVALEHAGRDGAPVLMTMHGWGTSKSPDQARTDIEVLRSVELVVVPNESSALLLRRFGLDSGRLRIIRYGLPTDLAGSSDRSLAAARAAIGSLDGRAVVCCVGTIGERKNQQLLVAALALLPVDTRPLCVFVGDGDSEALVRLARDRGVDAWVRCVGYQDEPRAFMRLSDWMVLPSRSEGLPLAVLEAFAEAVPSLVSDIAELRELVQDGQNGLLFESDSADALARRLATALTMPEAARTAIQAAARRDYEQRHRFGDMVGAYFAAYALLGGVPDSSAPPSCAA
jgi:glycosyltransferase involved in cell wall biosynthesis